MKESLINLCGVEKVFLTDELETKALSNINLAIMPGEFVSICGPSGCGKSTLLAILGLLDTPSRGEYVLNGRKTHELPGAERARIRNIEIGFIFQAFNLISDLTVAENVELALTYRAGVTRAERRERAQEALAKVDMGHRARHYPSQLSGGQQQRVAIARALTASPSLLLADEPTGNLDSANADMVMEILRSLHREGSTICMVTHNPVLADTVSRRITLFDGLIVDDVQPHAKAA
ncbi:MAG: ABC transporter ATP-binding protein [Pseudomonadota bacterium]|nr:ABC transporter ATP-binding protein [Pseudomonadota bacterium]